MKNILNLSILLLAVAALALAQSPVASTTASGALTASTSALCVASATSVVLPSLASGKSGSILILDNEAMQVLSQGSGGSTCFNVKRGVLGTRAEAHATGITVWILGAAVSSGDPSRPITASDFLATYRYSPGSQFSTPMSPITAASVTYVAGTVWQVQVNIPASTILKGACTRNGATVGTDKIIVSLYDKTGALLANSTTAGTTTAGASQFQCIAFSSPVAVVGPATYFIGLQGNGTTDNFASYAAGALPSNYGATSTTGTFGTLPAITPPITFTASKGPYAFVY